jgi:hypothetical protein
MQYQANNDIQVIINHHSQFLLSTYVAPIIHSAAFEHGPQPVFTTRFVFLIPARIT